MPESVPWCYKIIYRFLICIFLYDCNEFSVELCRTALGEWTGKRLVLVGSKWERMIEYLDDIDGVECFYEPEPDDS